MHPVNAFRVRCPDGTWREPAASELPGLVRDAATEGLFPGSVRKLPDFTVSKLYAAMVSADAARALSAR